MPVSYLSAIRNVLDTYPPSKGLFREILQNSEDAKATNQIFVLDRCESALLAYNDSQFTENDFKSLFNLWDSSKKEDTLQVTDKPQVLSQSTLAILDPLNEDNNKTEVRFELDTAEKRAITHFFALYLFQRDIATADVFQGTVVRLPLRAHPSPISDKVFSIEDIHQLLSDFIKDELRITLLFLTNLSSITIYEIGVDGHITRLAESFISRSQETILNDIPLPTCTASFVDLVETTTTTAGPPAPPEHWRILRTFSPTTLASSTLSARLGFDATARLAAHKLRPSLAIAANLSLLHNSTPTPTGRLFTYLPLPLLTRFGVHIHAPFALTPSREKLQNREETPAHGTDYHIFVEWNKFLFDTYLPQAWALLLHMLAASGIPDVFAAWPPRQSPTQLGDSGYWAALPAHLVETVVASRCRVWPVVGSPARFCELAHVIVASGAAGESEALLDALAAAISLGHIDAHLAGLLRRNGPTTLNVAPLTPPTVLTYLHALLPVDPAWTYFFWLWMHRWPSSHELYPSLADLPLLPTQAGLKPTSSPVFEPTRIHPLLLAPLKKLCLPFLPASFSPGSAARSGLQAFRTFSDINDIGALLDALDPQAVLAFECDEDAAGQLTRHIAGRMSSRDMNEDRRRKLRALPIFAVHPLASYQGQGQGQRRLVRIPEGYAVFQVCLARVSFLPVLADTVILDESHSIDLVRALDHDTRLGGLLDDLDVLSLSLTHFASQPETIQQAIVEYMAYNARGIPGDVIEVLGNTPFIVVGDGSSRPPCEVIDPSSPLAALYEAGSRVLPHTDFTNKNADILRHLRSLDLMQSALSTAILKERIEYITCTQDHHCARELVRVIYKTSFKLPQIDEIHHTKWLPTPKGLLSPTTCRDDPEHRHLFDRVLSPLDDGLRTDDAFRAMFGWDQPVPFEVLAQQLCLTLTAAHDSAHNVVCDIIRELIDKQLSDQDTLRLKDAVTGHAWVPVAGTSDLARSDYAVFDGADSSVGFHHIMFPDPKSVRFFTRMGCSKRPSTGAILSRLSDLEKEPPALRVADKARRLLSLLPDAEISNIDRSRILVPDKNCILRPLSSVFYDDIGASAILVTLDTDEHLAHDIIEHSLAKSLNMGTLGLKSIDFKSLEIDMGEELTTTIANKLRSYTPRQIMTEFIANASDAGATEFGILVDEVDPPRDRILSRELADVINGPSLVLYNNSVFTLADFEGICRTGVGGKSSRSDSIGQFGFGALTMFHLTDVGVHSGDMSENRPLERLGMFIAFGEISSDPLKTIHKSFYCSRRYVRSRSATERLVRLISLDLTEEMTVNEFKTRVFDVTIHKSRHTTESQPWHVVSTSCNPEVSQSLVKYRLRSPIVISIAARTDIKRDVKKERRPLYKFFSSLPLMSSHLPVHISAPFILSDDRRQIRLDNLDLEAADYNRWLLSTVIPPLYLFLLSDLLEHDHDNVPWWPGYDHEENELSQLVTSSFYKDLKTSNQRVFLPNYKAEPTPLTSEEVVLFHTLTDDDALDQVFRLLEPPLVLLPFQLVSKTRDAGLTQLTPAYLSDLMRRSSFDPAQLQLRELNRLLKFLGQSADDLLGLPLLPLSSGDFGVIELDTGASQSYFRAPESMHILFPDSQYLLHASFDPMPVLSQLRQTFNVKKIDGPSLKLLLATVLEERTVARHGAYVQNWIVSFWDLFADLGMEYKYIENFPLVPTTISGVYVSLDNCKTRSAVVLSTKYEDAWLWSTLTSLGLTIVVRHSEGLPRYLRKILMGTEFSSYLHFTDLLSAMAAGQQVVHEFSNLDVNVRRQFADWCRSKLESAGSFLPHLHTFARELPIWPTYHADDDLGYQSANNVTVLPQGIPVSLARRFMNIPSTPYSPCFVTLKKEVLSFAVFFGSLNLPRVLSENDVIPYKELLAMFLDNSQNFQSFETLRVPNANLVLRHPRDLYAHDRLFISAFEGSPEFILTEFMDMEPRLFTFGMKREADLDVDVFTACASALANASSISDVNPERARIVFEAYCEVLPVRIYSYQRYLWNNLDGIRFISRDPSRRKSAVPIGLNPAIYAKPLPVIVSPSELMLQEFEPIVWTQRAHFLHPPGERIQIANPSLGHPSFYDVVEHLKTLALRILPDFPSSHRLCRELTKTYEWLNDNCNEENNASLLATLHAQPVFLNVVDPSEFAAWEWHTADQLLLNETKAVRRFHPVKAFLLPFEKLLHAAGVQAVVHPEIPPSSEGLSDSDQLASIRKAFQEMRQARLLTDVRFVSADDDGEEEILPCHRAFLATCSSYFYDAFTTEMEPANLDASVRNPKTIDVREYSNHRSKISLTQGFSTFVLKILS
ncbi:hypothetical protein C0993_004197 [Termitomyces sp. T159_Od127]|nr:hypothetical protein C0993_004197 [Termitomyces sp. T159_Od127]